MPIFFLWFWLWLYNFYHPTWCFTPSLHWPWGRTRPGQQQRQRDLEDSVSVPAVSSLHTELSLLFLLQTWISGACRWGGCCLLGSLFSLSSLCPALSLRGTYEMQKMEDPKKVKSINFFLPSLWLLFLVLGSEIWNGSKSGSEIWDKHPGSATLVKRIRYSHVGITK